MKCNDNVGDEVQGMGRGITSLVLFSEPILSLRTRKNWQHKGSSSEAFTSLWRRRSNAAKISWQIGLYSMFGRFLQNSSAIFCMHRMVKNVPISCDQSFCGVSDSISPSSTLILAHNDDFLQKLLTRSAIFCCQWSDVWLEYSHVPMRTKVEVHILYILTIPYVPGFALANQCAIVPPNYQGSLSFREPTKDEMNAMHDKSPKYLIYKHQL